MNRLIVNKCLILTIAFLLALFIAGCGTPDATNTVTPTPIQPTNQTQNITDQVRQVVTGLGTDDTVTERDGALYITLVSNTPTTLDSVITAMTYISLDEKQIWQAHIANVVAATITATGVDSNGNAQDIAKATVTAATGNSLPWDSLSPLAAWKQFDKTWTGQGTEYSN